MTGQGNCHDGERNKPDPPEDSEEAKGTKSFEDGESDLGWLKVWLRIDSENIDC